MKDLRRKFNGNKGFTLIELIVVIAILAAMAALALPTMSGLIDKSKKQVAESNARTVYTAAQSYAVINPSAATISDSDLASLVGEGMTGSYTATCSAGNCLSATWTDADGIWSSTYTPSNGSSAFATTKSGSAV